MTQPVPPPQDHTGQIIAAGAIALALIAVESRVRQDIEDAIQTAFQTIGAIAVITAVTAPGTVLTGVALLSLPVLHRAITEALDKARTAVKNSIETGYTAAAQIAHTKLTDDLADFGYTVPSTLPDLGPALNRLLTDADTMFGHATTDLRNGIAAAYDGIQGPNPHNARTVAINQAATNSAARLRQRAQAAGATAVHQGSTDAQQAICNAFQLDTGTPGLLKRWRVISNDPCGMCAALDGTAVGINAEFDTNATTVDKDWRRVWRNLLGPPRHPNCRCQIELVVT